MGRSSRRARPLRRYLPDHEFEGIEVNIEAMLGVADLIEEKNRFTLAAWAVFLDGTTGTWSIAGYRDGRRKPTIDEMLHDPGCYGCIGGWTNVWAGHEDGV